MIDLHGAIVIKDYKYNPLYLLSALLNYRSFWQKEVDVAHWDKGEGITMGKRETSVRKSIRYFISTCIAVTAMFSWHYSKNNTSPKAIPGTVKFAINIRRYLLELSLSSYIPSFSRFWVILEALQMNLKYLVYFLHWHTSNSSWMRTDITFLSSLMFIYECVRFNHRRKRINQGTNCGKVDFLTHLKQWIFFLPLH